MSSVKIKQDFLSFLNIDNGDGLQVTWSHAVNSKDKLKIAIEDNSIMFIESDLIKSNQQNEVIMAHPPDTTSDLTFYEWFKMCKTSNKGLKLDFKTQDGIETCVQAILNEKDDLEMPIMLNADILQSNRHTPKPKIDADFFLKTCNLYPNAIVSPGWTTINSSSFNYSCFNVFEMFKLIQKYNLTQVTLPIRANWAIKSIHRLDWLIKYTKSTLTIWGHETDEFTTAESILLFRKYFPISIVFYDLPVKIRSYLIANIEDYSNILKQSNDKLIDYYLRSSNFKLDLWHTSNSQVFLSDFGGIMNGYGSILKTRKPFKAIEDSSVIYELFGKFELFKNINNNQIEKANDKEQENGIIIDKILADQTSLSGQDSDYIKISLRSSEDENYESIGSVVVYMFLNGMVKVQVNDKIIQEGNLFSKSNQFEVLITDVGENKDIHIDLINYDTNMNKYSLQFLVNSKYYPNQNFFIKLQLLSSEYALGIDCLKLADEISDPQDNVENY